MNYRKNLMLLKRKLLPLAFLPIGIIVISSCAAASDGPTENPAVINQAPISASSSLSPTSSSAPKPAESKDPVVSNKNDIARLKSSLNQSLSTLVSSVAYPSASQIKDAVIATSGHQEIEISPVETPTGLRADSIEVAFAVDSKECLFGYIRGQDVSTSLLPVLPNGKCMIGITS